MTNYKGRAMGQFDDNEIYPNQPLSDVACEVRFKGEMAVECQRHLFWNKIRTDYPDILVPQIQEGQAVALQHYRFRNSVSTRTVLVALNSLAFSETKYSGHKSFIAEFERLATIFHATFPDISQISRVGWRYVNVMPFSREGGVVPLNRILKLDVTLPSKMFEKTAALDFGWTGKCLDGEVIFKVAAVARKYVPEQEALILDIDFGQTRQDIKWKEVKGIVEDARRKCREIFEALITDEYRNYLRGQTI
jgi:uncharacterized protein (TIGR04255 family)